MVSLRKQTNFNNVNFLTSKTKYMWSFVRVFFSKEGKEEKNPKKPLTIKKTQTTPTPYSEDNTTTYNTLRALYMELLVIPRIKMQFSECEILRINSSLIKKKKLKKKDVYVKVPETNRQLYNSQGDVTKLLYNGATVATLGSVKLRGKRKSYCGWS